VKIRIKDRRLVFPVNSQIKLAPCETRMLWVNLPVGGNRLAYITHEITPVSRDRRAFDVKGNCGDTCELAFEKNCRITLDGKSRALKKQSGLYIGSFRFQSEKTRLRIG